MLTRSTHITVKCFKHGADTEGGGHRGCKLLLSVPQLLRFMHAAIDKLVHPAIRGALLLGTRQRETYISSKLPVPYWQFAHAGRTERAIRVGALRGCSDGPLSTTGMCELPVRYWKFRLSYMRTKGTPRVATPA